MKPDRGAATRPRLPWRQRLKNAGFSLVELMIAVALLGIGLTIIGMSVNTIFSLRATECQKEIAGKLSEEKVACLSRDGRVYMRLYQDANGVFVDQYVNGVLDDQKQVGNVSVKVFYTTTYSGEIALDATGIIIAFNRSDGSFMTVGNAWALQNIPGTPAHATEYFKTLYIKGAGRVREIELQRYTGKYTLAG